MLAVLQAGLLRSVISGTFPIWLPSGMPPHASPNKRGALIHSCSLGSTRKPRPSSEAAQQFCIGLCKENLPKWLGSYTQEIMIANAHTRVGSYSIGQHCMLPNHVCSVCTADSNSYPSRGWVVMWTCLRYPKPGARCCIWSFRA